MSALKLFCWVLTKSTSPFPVDIGKEMTVGDLKDEIKEKMRPALDDIVASELLLWKVSDCIDLRDKVVNTRIFHVKLLSGTRSYF